MIHYVLHLPSQLTKTLEPFFNIYTKIKTVHTVVWSLAEFGNTRILWYVISESICTENTFSYYGLYRPEKWAVPLACTSTLRYGELFIFLISFKMPLETSKIRTRMILGRSIELLFTKCGYNVCLTRPECQYRESLILQTTNHFRKKQVSPYSCRYFSSRCVTE